MNNNDDSEDSEDSGSEASSRGALLHTREGRGGSKHDNRGKSKRKAKKMVPMVWYKGILLITLLSTWKSN